MSLLLCCKHCQLNLTLWPWWLQVYYSRSLVSMSKQPNSPWAQVGLGGSTSGSVGTSGAGVELGRVVNSTRILSL